MNGWVVWADREEGYGGRGEKGVQSFDQKEWKIIIIFFLQKLG